MKFDAPKNANYAATIVRLHTVVDLTGLDFLVGVPVLGHQALVTKEDAQTGSLAVVFTSETQLSDDYCRLNNLYRHADRNVDESQTGYLEDNRRVKALRLRGHVSNALLMPLSSLAYTGAKLDELQEGDTFDVLNGHEICRKYVIKTHVQNPAKSKIAKAFKRVDAKLFPEHLETDQYWRNKHLLKNDREVVVTQKLHGTSWRGGNIPVRRKKKLPERLLNKVFKTPDYEYAVVFGSRKVIKDPNNPNQAHFYDNDIWTEYGQKIGDLIPEGYIVYGELVGFNSDGMPLQKNYTYHLTLGTCELYVYRVAFINSQGVLSDLPWDGVREFCRNRGLKVTPELFRFSGDWHKPWDDRDLECQVNGLMDQRYADVHPNCAATDDPLPLSDKKSVDEGICLRQEGLNPVILKAKAPKFLEHETKLLDKDEVDMESAA